MGRRPHSTIFKNLIAKVDLATRNRRNPGPKKRKLGHKYTKYDRIFSSRQLTERVVCTTDRLGRVIVRRHGRDDDDAFYVRQLQRRGRGDDDGVSYVRRLQPRGRDDGDDGVSYVRRPQPRGRDDGDDDVSYVRQLQRRGRDDGDDVFYVRRRQLRGRDDDGDGDSCRLHRYER